MNPPGRWTWSPQKSEAGPAPPVGADDFSFHMKRITSWTGWRFSSPLINCLIFCGWSFFLFSGNSVSYFRCFWRHLTSILYKFSVPYWSPVALTENVYCISEIKACKCTFLLKICSFSSESHLDISGDVQSSLIQMCWYWSDWRKVGFICPVLSWNVNFPKQQEKTWSSRFWLLLAIH